jgi:hypothetical protein
MELPRFLRKRVTRESHGIVELCPDEYNLDTLSAQIEAALAACEELVLEPSGGIKAISPQP